MEHEQNQYNYIPDYIDQIKSKEDPFPQSIEIHPTDKCNHSCFYCFHGGDGHDATRDDHLLSLEDYRSLFDQMNQHGINKLTISGGGEPLLYKHFIELVAMAREADLHIRLVTHGNLITKRITKALMMVDEIRISIDAIIPATYTKIRNVAGSKLFATLEGIKLMNMVRSFQEKPKLGVSFLINDHNVDESVMFAYIMKDLMVDDILIKHNIYDGENPVNDKIEKTLKDLHVWKKRIPNLEIRQIGALAMKGHGCFVPHFKATFNPYGQFYSCPLASQPNEKNGYLLGRFPDHTLNEIWRKSAVIRDHMIDRVGCNACNHTDSHLNHEIIKQIRQI